MLMDKKCDQSGLRKYVGGQTNRNTKVSKKISFAMMDQYADKDTEVSEEVVANGLDEEHVDDDGSDAEAQVNITIEREPEFSCDVDRGFLIGRGSPASKHTKT
jgi:hypothetical protein